MKEKVKQIQNIEELKKDKIFKVLNKKRKNDNSFINNIKSPKKNMFILFKPIKNQIQIKKILKKIQ